MKLVKLILIGVQGVLAHKTRSFLTMTGIIFGIAAVIAMMSIGAGARQEFLSIIALMGINNIYIRDNPSVREKGKQETISKGLVAADLAAIQKICVSVTEAVPVKEHTMRLASKYRQIEQKLTFTTNGFFRVLNIPVLTGRKFTSFDIKQCAKVCIIGNSIARELFPIVSPIREVIDMQRDYYSVIGQIGKKAMLPAKKIDVDISDYNRMIFLPISAYELRFGDASQSNVLTSGIIQVHDQKTIGATVRAVRRILLERHNGIEDFEIIIPEELLKQHQKTQNIFNIVMICIAGISLLVGGIGIMNIMLASILERTREIGVRRAVGATKTDITLQFLLEAVILTFLGGFFGILGGLVAARVISSFAGWQTLVTGSSIFVSFAVATGTGILFGLYPAKKAADLHPIEALRYE